VCLTGSHRGGPAIRRCSYNKPATTSCRRSTRLGCERVLARIAPGAVLLQQACHHLAPYEHPPRVRMRACPVRTEALLLQTHLPPPRIVGTPASGAIVDLPGSPPSRGSYTRTCQ